MLSLCSLRSHNTTLVRLAARPHFARSRFARLLCSLRSPPRSTTLTCALASLVPAASPACFARLAGCSLRSTRLSRCSLRSSSLLPSSLASLGPLLLFARSARCLACFALASLVSSPAARSARRLDCDSLCPLLAAGCSACCSLFARRLPDRSARPSHSPCPLRLLQRLISDGQGGQWTGSICGIDEAEKLRA